ncbi:uncharacterized protein LOC143431316 isoform X2 [Xylocopa sonorina]
MEHPLHTIKNENQTRNLKTLNHLTLKHGGGNVLFKVLLGMQIPSARLDILTIIEHSQIDIRNRKVKFRAAGEKFFPILETIYYILEYKRSKEDSIGMNRYLGINFESF